MFKPAPAIISFIYAAFKSLLLLLILSNPSPENQPFKVEIPASAERSDHDERLQAEADALLPLFDNMPPVPVYLKDEAFLKSGTNTEKGAAYTHCYGHEVPTVYVKKVFYETANRKQLINLLKHELTHAWLCRRRRMSGHDAEFRRKFTQVGGVGN
jgi:predicted metalloprotease with PDZ domain